MATDKQTFEINAVSLFREAGGFDRESVLMFGSDPPDVLMRIGERTIGIEVRRLYNDEKNRGGSPDRRRLSICTAVVDLAAELHKQISNRCFYVRVHFNCSNTIQDTRVPIIAAMLVDLVSKLPLNVGGRFTLRSEDLWGPMWPEEVDYVSGGLLIGESPPFWGLSDASWVGETTFALIQAAFDSKESRTSAFAEVVDEAWLLLVCDGSVGTSLLRLHTGIAGDSYCTSFDRAFVMDYSGKKFSELTIST